MDDKGSKIIVTTCNKEDESITSGTFQPYRLGCPSEDQLRSLFEKVAFGGQEPKNSLNDKYRKGNCKEMCRSRRC